MLKKYDFEVIEPADFSIDESIAIMEETALLVSLHGAALTNILFMQKDTHVIEFVALEETYPFFCALASALEVNYEYFACQETPEWSEYLLDVNAFEQFLVQFINKYGI